MVLADPGARPPAPSERGRMVQAGRFQPRWRYPRRDARPSGLALTRTRHRDSSRCTLPSGGHGTAAARTADALQSLRPPAQPRHRDCDVALSARLPAPPRSREHRGPYASPGPPSSQGRPHTTPCRRQAQPESRTAPTPIQQTSVGGTMTAHLEYKRIAKRATASGHSPRLHPSSQYPPPRTQGVHNKRDRVQRLGLEPGKRRHGRSPRGRPRGRPLKSRYLTY